ncbi:MAG TPA: ABC-F family ATP-binding cassette domain-containing protein [Thermoanaerobaculia bacterium]|jgi:ATP-binding cassette subfamily F protein uup|nr:ABC-F family ATP-binding cassette domain-containing protein [Thermoanaerobaculia bacterium]
MPPVPLVICRDVAKSFGGRPVFEGLSLTLAAGDHVGLVGPNGSGKSTLLRILAGSEEPDAGERVARKGTRIGYVPQDPVFAPGRTVEEVVVEALAAVAPLADGERARLLSVALGSAGFDDRSQRTDTLSGGWRKRLAIARELAAAPDVLLLDEPTNHLDLEGIVWLEELLRTAPKAFVVVSHDRYFLDRIARRMLELDRRYLSLSGGGLFAVDGSYADFLEARDERLRNDAVYRETLANLVRREVEWLRRGPKARTTKAKARVDAAQSLIAELSEARERAAITASAGIDFTASGRRTKRLWTGEGLSKRFGDRTILASLDLELVAGSRLGILGPNGSGKTTLLRLIVGELPPDDGTIQRAERLQVVYFDQNRESVDPESTLARALAPEGDHVVYRGRSLHVASWAARFLFRAEQLRTPVSRLSGGERARIAIARLMLRPADVLVLDEPTNDLDIPTLDVLEESLLEHEGAIVLVTHDRLLLDRVSNGILALDGEGGAERFADVAQWLERRQARAPRAKAAPAAAPPSKPRAKKLSYREQQEWDGMEGAVLAAEERLGAADAAVADPAVATDAAALQGRAAAAAAARVEVERLYARWAELEGKLS